MREIQDHFFREAKREGFLSRAAYKLIEIDDRKKVLRRGDAVLDCGAAPGSWLQVAAQRVGDRGMVVGIDLTPVRFTAINVRTIVGDLGDIPDATLLEPISAGPSGTADRRFDCLLSDMAPSTTGDPRADHFRSAQLCELLLDRAPGLLTPGGNLVMKVFEGETYPALLARTRGLFEQCKGFKPRASRSESVEMYIVAHRFRPAPRVSDGAQDRGAVPLSPVRRPPSRWKQ